MIPRDIRYVVTSLPMQAGNVPTGAPAPAPSPVVALENVPSTMTVNVQAAAQVRNTGTVAAPWSIAVGSGLTVTPNSGTLAPGATQALALNATGSGNYTLVLSVTGGSGTGTPAYIVASVASPPPAPAPQAITLSALAGLSTTVGSSLGFSAALSNPASLPLVGTPEAVSGPALTPSPGTVTWALGDLNKAFTATWAAAGTAVLRVRGADGTLSNSLSITVAPAPSPTPPPPPAPSVGTGGDATFSLASTAGVTNEAFSVGMGLAEGQFPSGTGIVASGTGLANHQVQVRTTWPDGSAKIAVVSGKATIAAASAQTITLRQGTAATGTALTEADLLASGVDATLQFGGGPVMTLSALIGVAAVSNSTGLTTNGRVRQLTSGPQMSEWVYAARLNSGNAHVIGWMVVRYYGGTKVHILPWVENGFTRVAGVVGQAGTLTFTMGGTTRYNQANVHVAHHCRASAQSGGFGHWTAGTAPDLYAAPDPNYLQSTKIVPGYFIDTVPATATMGALAQDYSPTLFGQLTTSPRDSGGNATNCGDFGTGMANAGYHIGVGLLPGWDAFYLTSNGHKLAWNASIANAMGYSRYGVHFRDEVTMLPFNPADGVNKTLSTAGSRIFAGTRAANLTFGATTGTGVSVVADADIFTTTDLASNGYALVTGSGGVALIQTVTDARHVTVNITTALASTSAASGSWNVASNRATHSIGDIGANQFGGTEILPAPTGYAVGDGTYLTPEYWAQTHHPAAGFLAYLLTGHEFFLELSQFVAGTCFLRQNNVDRNYGDGVQWTHKETVRGQAWGVRSIFMAAALSTDGTALKTGLSAIAANNVNAYHLAYISGPLGVFGGFGTPRNYGNFRPDTASYRVNAFEYDFSVGAWGFGLDLKPVSGATLTKMREYAKWHAQWPVARLGPLGDANSFGFNEAARTNFIAIAPGNTGSQWDTNTGWYSNPGQMFAETPGGSNASNTINTIGSYSATDDPTHGYFPDATSYWGNIQIPLMYAVELGVTGASAAYQRLVGASNWSTLEADFATKPGYAHRPRNVYQWGVGSATGSMSGDIWTPGKDSQGRINKAAWSSVPGGSGTYRWIEIAGTRIDTQLNAKLTSAGLGWTADQLWGPTFNPGGSLFQSWSGMAQDTALGRLWSFNGGHSDGFNNGLYRFDTNKMSWAIECLPSNRSLMTSTYLNGGNATFDPDSHALALANFNANNASGTTTGTLVPALNGVFYDEVGSDPTKPTARHSYQGMVYAPEIGTQGSVFMHARRLWRFDIASGKWVFKRLVNDQVRANPITVPAPNATGLIEIHAAEAALAIWDEVNQKVLCSASGSAGAGAFAYNWNTQSWGAWTGSYGLNYNNAAHVRVGRKMVAFTPPVSDVSVYVGRYWQYDLDTGAITANNVQFAGGITLADFPSGYAFYDGYAIVYVPPLNRYWVCTRKADGSMFWVQLDPTTSPWTLSPLTFANTQPVTQRLILGRVQWIEDLKAVILFDHCFANAFVCKV